MTRATAPYLWPPYFNLLLRLVHVLTFACWTPAWLVLSRGITGARWGVAHWAVPVVAAIVSEVIQVWLPGHTPTLSGAVASLIGVALGLVIGRLMVRPATHGR